MALTTLPPVWIMSLNRLFFFGGYPLVNNLIDIFHEGDEEGIVAGIKYVKLKLHSLSIEIARI